MASILRQIVAGPRARHGETGLDLCYVTDNIIATSGPSGTYPQRAYRNPLDALVRYLNHKHGDQWAIWEFRAEGTGYPDSEVYNRIYHYPWPDHHPPPFALIPLMMGSMRNWLKGGAAPEKFGKAEKVHEAQVSERVVVVHCKAGKGRSGSVSCSYLISEEGWKAEDALKRFTERRMRQGFGAGVSIPSQLRYISYVDRWTKGGKKYVERPVEVLEVHLWGLRDGVKVAIEGFVDEGKIIKNFHTFTKDEREMVRGGLKKNSDLYDVVREAVTNEKNNAKNRDGLAKVSNAPLEPSAIEKAMNEAERRPTSLSDFSEAGGGDVVLRPTSPVTLHSNDICMDFERRNTAMTGLTMVTAVAHVWFNVFFEGQGPESGGTPQDSGVFEIAWEAMDGLKGSSRKGTKAFDKMAVVWKSVPDTLSRRTSIIINEPTDSESIRDTQPADWRGEGPDATRKSRTLGLRESTPASAPLSRAGSPGPEEKAETGPVEDDSDTEGVQPFVDAPEGQAEKYLLPTSRELPGPMHTAPA